MAGVALGFSIAAPPGPVTALSVQQVVSRSWLSGWLVMLGATVADGALFVITYYGVARLATPEERDLLFVAGGALMVYLAIGIVRGARKPAAITEAATRGRFSRSSIGRYPFLLGLSIGLTNPYQLGWWIAIGAGMVAKFGGSIAIGFFVGIVAWTLILTTTVHAGVHRYGRLAPAISYASAAIIGAFGLWFLAFGLLAIA